MAGLQRPVIGYIAALASAVLLAAALVTVPRPTGATGLQAELDLSSPAATYRSFLGEVSRIGSLVPAYRADPTFAKLDPLGRAMIRLGLSVFDLSDTPLTTRRRAGVTAVGYLADILHRLPEVPSSAFPAMSPPPAHWTIPGTEIRMVRLTEGPHEGNYVFSAETFARLPEFHAAVIAEPLQRPVTLSNWVQTQRRMRGPLLARLPIGRLPAALLAPLFDNPAWKIILALAFALASFVTIWGWWRIVRRVATGATPWRRHAAWLTVPALLTLLLVLLEYFYTWEIDLGGSVALGAQIMITALFHLTAAWAAWLACWLVVEAIIAMPSISDDSYDAHLLRLLARVGALAAAATIIIFGANNIGVPELGLLAGVSIGGIALAFAAQSTIENLFGGVSLFADRPFHVGDLIRFDGEIGTVETIGPRSTRIRGLDGTLTVVPNADLAKARLTNMTKRNKCLFRHQIGVRYETSGAQLKWLIEALRERVAAHPLVANTAGFPRVRLVGFGDSSINIEIYANVATTAYSEFLEVQETLTFEIVKAVEEAGTSFAFPSSTTYLARDSGLDTAAKARIEQDMDSREGTVACPLKSGPP